MAARRKAGLLRGYKALPGTARRVQGPKGEVLSHRQYRNVVVRRAGWRNLSELETDEQWAKFRYKIRKQTPGADTSYRSQLVADYVKVKRAREGKPVRRGRPVEKLEPAGRDFADTPLGRLLIASGQAEPDQRWGVDSPAKRPRGQTHAEYVYEDAIGDDEIAALEAEGELVNPSEEELGF